MLLKAYSVFDGTAQAFAQPFYMANDGMAIRAFAGTVNDQKDGNTIAAHPEQFTLFQIGTFDDKTGVIEKLETPRSIGLGVEFVENDRKIYRDADMDLVLKEIDKLKNLLMEK